MPAAHRRWIVGRGHEGLMTSAAIRLERITKAYSNGHAAIRGVDLEVAAREFLVLVGPSGSGKSTLLRLIAGLERLTTGRILIDAVDVTDVPPQGRDVAMVFQSYALYPHMTVRRNLAYGLEVRRTNPAIVAQRVQRIAEALGIERLLERRPAQLSGGERQRVALGRALVREPKAFLLDEPLSNLDPALRGQARAELRRLHQRLGATIVYVTHDQEEAMTLGVRVAVMRDGTVEQVAPPLELYAKPVNTFIARFIGAPSMNLLPAALIGVAAPPGALAGIRPHDVSLGTSGPLRATIELVEPRGHDYLLHVRPAGADVPPLLVVTTMAVPPGDTVFPQFPSDRLHLFDGRDGRRIV
jgi:ABC-type sugar transport system ATPase subunit